MSILFLLKTKAHGLKKLVNYSCIYIIPQHVAINLLNYTKLVLRQIPTQNLVAQVYRSGSREPSITSNPVTQRATPAGYNAQQLATTKLRLRTYVIFIFPVLVIKSSRFKYSSRHIEQYSIVVNSNIVNRKIVAILCLNLVSDCIRLRIKKFHISVQGLKRKRKENNMLNKLGENMRLIHIKYPSFITILRLSYAPQRWFSATARDKIPKNYL